MLQWRRLLSGKHGAHFAHCFEHRQSVAELQSKAALQACLLTRTCRLLRCRPRLSTAPLTLRLLLFPPLTPHPPDVWSIGCLLYELLTGRPLFPGRDGLDQLSLIAKGTGPLPPWMLAHLTGGGAAGLLGDGVKGATVRLPPPEPSASLHARCVGTPGCVLAALWNPLEGVG